MASGLRQVELVEHGVDETQPSVQRASHVVGIDESGNSSDGPFVMTAVQCPRSRGEQLAELLIDLGLEPWKSKSSSTPAGMTNAELSAIVADLIARFDETGVTWAAVAGWGSFESQQRAAIACITASKALTGGAGPPPTYDGPAAFIHDGGARMYGSRQVVLRRAESRQFNGFGDRVTPVYLTQLRGGDKTYPEITAADYVSGYLRSKIMDRGIDGVGCELSRIDESWRAAGDPPVTLYSLRARNRRRSSRGADRAAAWVEGRRPSPGAAWNEQPFRSIVDRLTSDVIREYLLEEL